MTKLHKQMLSNLQGQIERVTYTNEENGFTIAKLKVYGQRDLVTIVGNLMSLFLVDKSRSEIFMVSDRSHELCHTQDLLTKSIGQVNTQVLFTRDYILCL